VNRAAVFAWLVRAALLALALQLGGVVHGAADVLAAAGVLEGEHEECPADGACDDCLPGCPNCHCAGALRTVVPGGAPALEFVRDGAPVTVPATARSRAALGPTLPCVYRPPRAAFVAAVS
jgi:hypothetical protein